MKKVAVLQSNYIPWKGYFDLIASVDEFILFDDMQYTRRDWRNRNQIKTPQGLQWLTVPVLVKGKYTQTIRETRVDGHGWAHDHWRALEQNYRRAPHFAEVAHVFQPVYLELARLDFLSEINRLLLETICGQLGIATRITDCANYTLTGEKSERLVSLTQQAGADVYVSGPSARDYLDETAFSRRGLQVEWFDYSGYAPYPQLWEGFVHNVTVLDLLFNCGPQARQHLKAGNP